MEINPNSSQPSDSSPSTESSIQRPGEYLAQIRTSKKLDLEQVSQALTIPLKTLIALEKDDYKALPEATFIKAFYRSYAKFLEVDVSPIIASFDRIYTADTGLSSYKELNESPLQMMGKLSNSSNSSKWKKWLAYAFGLLILLGIITVAVQKMKGSSASQSNDFSQVEVLDLNGNNSAAKPTEKSKSSAAKGDKLHLELNRPTSVHIVDSKGKVLVTGRQTATLDLTGEAPFQIRIDDAAAVTMSLNNENVVLANYMVNGRVDFRLEN